MGKLSLISCLAIASLISVSACALDSTPDPSKDTSDVSILGNPEAPSVAPNETTDEPLGITSDALITPNSCSVHLNFCDRPNSSIGTDCTESGCSLPQAIAACKSIVASVGCGVHCNAVMRDSSGAIIAVWLPC